MMSKQIATIIEVFKFIDLKNVFVSIFNVESRANN